MPLVAGTTIRKCRSVCPHYAMSHSPTSIRLSLAPRRGRANVLFLSRGQAFTEDEVKLSADIVRKWAAVFADHKPVEDYLDVVAGRCQVEAIAEFLDFSARNCLLRILDVMIGWGGQSYEGRRIIFSVGLEEAEGEPTAPTFIDLEHEDFLKVMTSGYDTVLVCDRQGRVLRHDTLVPALLGMEDGAAGRARVGRDVAAMEHAYAPVHYLPLARWAAGGRYAASLNREGEILLFKDHTLLFVRRRGQWIFLTHSAYIAGLGGRGRRVGVRRALYQTMLDVSFKRSGGCIGLWNARRSREDVCVAAADRLDRPEGAMQGGTEHTGETGEKESLSPKNRFLRRIIGGRKFQDLPRKLRQELVSIDGATVLLHDGTILAVGAILRIEGGSAGGGRTAAAMELAKQGVGVKISNDGQIAYWMDLDGKKNSLPKYEIG